MEVANIERLSALVDDLLKQEKLDLTKLLYIAQSIDVMSFHEKHHPNLIIPILNRIYNLESFKKNGILGPIHPQRFPDLNKLGLVRCATFDRVCLEYTLEGWLKSPKIEGYNRIIIAGGRGITGEARIHKILDEKLKENQLNDPYNTAIISGLAPGIDTFAMSYAYEKGYNLIKCPAKWDDLTTEPVKIKVSKYGKKYNALAGFNRNEDMAKIASHLVLIWNGKSPGSANMKKLAEKYNLKLIEVIIDE